MGVWRWLGSRRPDFSHLSECLEVQPDLERYMAQLNDRITQANDMTKVLRSGGDPAQNVTYEECLGGSTRYNLFVLLNKKKKRNAIRMAQKIDDIKARLQEGYRNFAGFLTDLQLDNLSSLDKDHPKMVEFLRRILGRLSFSVASFGSKSLSSNSFISAITPSLRLCNASTRACGRRGAVAAGADQIQQRSKPKGGLFWGCIP